MVILPSSHPNAVLAQFLNHFNYKTINKMKHNHHEEAAKHHEAAATHHREAHKNHQEGNDEKASTHAHAARGHAAHAEDNAKDASKKHSEKMGGKNSK